MRRRNQALGKLALLWLASAATSHAEVPLNGYCIWDGTTPCKVFVAFAPGPNNCPIAAVFPSELTVVWPKNTAQPSVRWTKWPPATSPRHAIDITASTAGDATFDPASIPQGAADGTSTANITRDQVLSAGRGGWPWAYQLTVHAGCSVTIDPKIILKGEPPWGATTDIGVPSR